MRGCWSRGSRCARWCCRTASSTTTRRTRNTTRPASTPSTSSKPLSPRWAARCTRAPPAPEPPARGAVAALLPMSRRRLDLVLVERGLAETRSQAQALIMAGLVWSDGRRLEKPGEQVADALPIEVRGREHPWVSRGGMKLEHALRHFAIEVGGKIALDIGASTG